MIVKLSHVRRTNSSNSVGERVPPGPDCSAAANLRGTIDSMRRREIAEATPRVRIAGACEKFGQAEVIRRCLDLLADRNDDHELLVILGAGHAQQLIAKGMPEEQAYWVRVWAARGLLWAGMGKRTSELQAALTDKSWRVREMTCKVIARYRIGDLLDDVAALRSDPIARVRAAAERASTRIVKSLA